MEINNYDKILMIIGKRVYDVRKAKNWSQETLTKNSGVPINKISEIEQGKQNFTLKTFLKVCDGLEMHSPNFSTTKNSATTLTKKSVFAPEANAAAGA